MSQRPYAKEIARMMGVLAAQGAGPAERAAAKPVTLVVAFSSDRGLCGGYNGSVIRATLNCLGQKAAEGKAVKCVFVGKKAYEGVKIRSKVDLAHYEEFGAKITFRKAGELSKKILPLFESGEVDEVIFIYNEFKNAISQVIRTDSVLPLALEAGSADPKSDLLILEPSKQELFESLSSKYFVIQIFKALLEAQASEHGSRMSAMENATKNAGDMIRKLTLQYNKQRQAAITKELLEIIAGSESAKTQA
jgi:F-type H+-transporting ATPase subunit gamma